MSSKIREQAEAYVLYKRGLGFGMYSIESMLSNFARFAEGAGHDGPIDLDIAVAWARSGGGHGDVYEAERYECARRVADFARVMDPSLPELPRGLMGKVKERVTPYVYTDEEVSLLMSCASRFFRQDPLRTMALEFSIGLMRACGLRPCEVEALEDGDFDQGGGILTIRNSKNGKSRLVPLEESAACAVAAYRDARDAARSDGSCTRLVVGTAARPITVGILESMFVELRMALLDRGQMWERRPPRLMDLRHTFAVRTIMRWHAEGADVNAMMPVLSRFMGHDSISETYWYLTGAPELMELAADAFEAHFGGWPR